MPEKHYATKEDFLAAYDAHADAIYKHCYFRLFNADRARELMQETFLRVWEQVNKGTEIKNIRAFLYCIATNLVIDETRKKKTDSLDALEEKGFNPSVTTEDKIFDQIDFQKIKLVLGQMDETYRDVIIMRYLEDLSITEIADALEISHNVVSVRLHRGLKELKKLLTAYYAAGS